jgi:hypothetical protein
VRTLLQCIADGHSARKGDVNLCNNEGLKVEMFFKKEFFGKFVKIEEEHIKGNSDS